MEGRDPSGKGQIPEGAGMSTLKTNNVQVGQSVTATNNFTLYQPSTPDGTVRLGVGNSGATTADVITATSAGNVGLGVTPAGQAGFKTLEVGGAGVSGLVDVLSGTALQLRMYNTSTNANIANNTSGGAILFNTTSASTGFGERMRIDASGRVTMPYQPAVFAQRTAGTYTTANVVVFNDVSVNIGSNYSNSTGRFTAPVAGTYYVICHCIIGNSGSAASADVYVRKNGAAVASGHNNHTDIWDNSLVECIVSLAVSDYIDIYYSPATAGTQFYGANPASSAFNGLSIHFLG